MPRYAIFLAARFNMSNRCIKILFCAFLILLVIFAVSCNDDEDDESDETNGQMINYMSLVERNSVVMGMVSPNQKYYNEVAHAAEFIQEMSVYDEELDSTYIIHITLPPDYDENKAYPMYMMTDGVWRLSDHAELRPMMVDTEIEGIIIVSIGYDYGIEAGKEEIRIVEFSRKSDLFLDFITNNLAPYLGELYAIDYRRSALMGHSYGGLFMYYAVFSHYKYSNNPFNYYVMASPSFYVMSNRSNWKYGDIFSEYFRNRKKMEKIVYLSAGDREDYGTLQSIDDFVRRAEEHGITTIEYTLFNGDHSSFVKQMLRESLLRFYKN